MLVKRFELEHHKSFLFGFLTCQKIFFLPQMLSNWNCVLSNQIKTAPNQMAEESCIIGFLNPKL